MSTRRGDGLGRANRLGNDPDWPHPPTACEEGAEHEWQPLSFVFESQLLDGEGRVLIRQPSTGAGRVYCVCMKCHSHTYIVTEWVGFYLPDPDTEREEAEDDDGPAPPPKPVVEPE